MTTAEGSKVLELTMAKKVYEEWFKSLQDRICLTLEKIERDYAAQYGARSVLFESKTWNRVDETQLEHRGGGGQMRVLEGGCVFEKAGVNVSTVFGQFPDQFAKEIPGTENDPSFWASGISLVIHPRNPYVPIVHMNTRHIITAAKEWFGGGADLTPCLPFEEDTNDFHNAMREACDEYRLDAYEEYRKWCDEYFYLAHRKEIRGVGGIFFDYLNSGDAEKDFLFIKYVGMKFIEAYDRIVRRRMGMQWGDEEQITLLKKRGRYAEFNLIYDRGTRFGLMTNGNTEAILMSLPPTAIWKVAA